MDGAQRLTPDEQAERRFVEKWRRIPGAKRRRRFVEEMASTKAALLLSELSRLSPAELKAYDADQAADVVYLVRGLRLTLERGKIRRCRADLERLRAEWADAAETARALATLTPERCAPGTPLEWFPADPERFAALESKFLALASEADELIPHAAERKRALTAEIQQVKDARHRAERERARDPVTARVQRIDKRAFFAAIDQVAARPARSPAPRPRACARSSRRRTAAGFSRARSSRGDPARQGDDDPDPGLAAALVDAARVAARRATR